MDTMGIRAIIAGAKRRAHPRLGTAETRRHGDKHWEPCASPCRLPRTYVVWRHALLRCCLCPHLEALQECLDSLGKEPRVGFAQGFQMFDNLWTHRRLARAHMQRSQGIGCCDSQLAIWS